MDGRGKTFEGACLECKLRDVCEEVGGCGLLKFYLDESEGTIRTCVDDTKNGIFYNHAKTNHFSSYVSNKSEDEQLLYEKVDYEDVKTFFADLYSDKLPKQAQIFYDRFFLGYTIEDLSIKYETAQSCCRTMLKAVTKNLNDALHTITKKQYGSQPRMKQLPQRVKYFLLYYLLDLSESEIAEECNANPDSVSSQVRFMADFIKEGRIVIELEDSDYVVKRLAKENPNRKMKDKELIRFPTKE